MWLLGMYVLMGMLLGVFLVFVQQVQFFIVDSYNCLCEVVSCVVIEGELYVLDLEMICCDGEYCWVFLCGNIECNDCDEVVVLFGIMQDIIEWCDFDE